MYHALGVADVRVAPRVGREQTRELRNALLAPIKAVLRETAFHVLPTSNPKSVRVDYIIVVGNDE